MKNGKILIIAPPRSGTGYASRCMVDVGFDVGHERLNENGISSWLWAVDCYDDARWGHNYQNIKPDLTIMLLRRPEDIIASLAFSAERAIDWMAKYVEVKGNTPVERASYAVLGWIKKCLERKPDFLVTLDDLPAFCNEMFGKFPDESLRGYNARKHRILTHNEMLKIQDNVFKIRAMIKEWYSNEKFTR